jgi:autophagy-related protein 17
MQLAADVAKSLQQKRAVLDSQAHASGSLVLPLCEPDACCKSQDWDALRRQRTDALDAILDALGGQVVPPDFHQSAAASDVFGLQIPEDEELEAPVTNGSSESDPDPTHSPATIRGELPSVGGPSRLEARRQQERRDRSRWKTLRDFVDERGIEEAIEKMEAERSALDVRASLRRRILVSWPF